MLKLALLLSSIKLPLGIPFFLNAITLPLGFLYLSKLRHIDKSYIFILTLLLSGIVGNFIFGFDIQSLARTFQILLMVLFSIYLSKNLYKIDYKLALYFAVVLSFIFILELAFNIRYYREIMGLAIPRLAGAHGDPNYNSVFIGAILCFYVIKVRKITPLTVFLILLAIPGFSRGAILGLIGLFFTIYFYGSFARKLSLLLLLLLFSQPLLIETLFTLLPQEDLIALNFLSSGRLSHWHAYYSIALDNFFGVGYFIGQQIEVNYLDYDLFKYAKPQQAHSMYFSSIADFGIVGYFSLFLFFILLYNRAKLCRYKLGVLNNLLLAFSSLNFLGEVSFWILVSLILMQEGFQEQAKEH
ncbi:O-antigen ligase family protein [Vibrio parahaemolyticus]|nr:O-antigen ligase family protein [Vibrio parahaemolyticus]EJG1590453.1 O-antigen ligase family protein [Vibrio parahaemolyticus]